MIRGVCGIDAPSVLQISLLLSPWRALRSGWPDRSMHHLPEAEFAQAPEISLLEGVS